MVDNTKRVEMADRSAIMKGLTQAAIWFKYPEKSPRANAGFFVSGVYVSLILSRSQPLKGHKIAKQTNLIFFVHTITL